jgi:hypothetical protein
VPDNGRVNARLVRFGAWFVAPSPQFPGKTAGAVALITVSLWLTACGSDAAPPDPGSSQAPAAAAAVGPRGDLARRVAASKDRRFTAAYSWTGAGAQRTVTVTLAADGTWRVDVPGGAQSGRTSVSMVGRAEGVYQCSAGGGCVRVARAAGTVPAAVDPKVHHPFTDWAAALADPDAALSVATAPLLPGVAGGLGGPQGEASRAGLAIACFSVEPTTVSIAPPLEPGIYCYGDDGMPTGFKTRFGTLTLAGAPGPAPSTADLSGPVSNGAPLATSAPPVPSVPSAPASSRR